MKFKQALKVEDFFQFAKSLFKFIKKKNPKDLNTYRISK
ncbi:hypothetical protein EZS27_019353 [termite gut metagenome]|uniref:Uncharacterized protein n=1 Tax=termite gut metagenome TaxID=433724 RepID=A0A5J4REK1_9ZZZZ